RRHHTRNGVIKGRLPVQVRLPEPLQEFEIVLPAALVQALAKPVSIVPACGSAITLVSVARRSRRRSQHRADHFARCVKNQRMPEIARNRLIALPALTDNSPLHRLSDSV